MLQKSLASAPQFLVFLGILQKLKKPAQTLDNLYKVLYIKSMSNLISISDARANLPDLVAKISSTLGRVTITVNGQPKAILVSAEELESLEETAEILAIPGALESIKKGENQIRKGEFISLEDLK